MESGWSEPVDPQALAALFDRPRPFAIGLEEEIMVLNPANFDLLPTAPDLLKDARLDERFKTELPASQIEIATHPEPNLASLQEELFDARTLLAQRLEGRALLAVAGVHPFAHPDGVLTDAERYRRTLIEYGPAARQQLICGLHIHLGMTGSDRVLAVHNELRNYLPEISALAANAPIYNGKDSAMASVRPGISAMLPRQGIPPVIPSWSWYADQLNWGIESGRLSRPGEWWWEMRPNLTAGTLEIRVPDAQTSVAEAMGVCGFVIGLALWVAGRVDRGEVSAPVPSWRIDENRWSAARYGSFGHLADLATGETVATKYRLRELIDAIGPVAPGVGSALDQAVEMIKNPPASRQSEIMRRHGARGVAEWLAGRFLEKPGPLG